MTATIASTNVLELKIDNAIKLPPLNDRFNGMPIHHQDLLKAVSHLWSSWATSQSSELPAMVQCTDLGDGDYVLVLKTNGKLTLQIVPTDTTQFKYMNTGGQSSAFSIIARQEGNGMNVCEPARFAAYARSLAFTLATNLSPVLIRDTRERTALRLVIEDPSNQDPHGSNLKAG